MPSAVATSKPEKPSAKPPSEEPNVTQVCTIIEKKIRNLEKRKQRLDSYKEERDKGKQLDPGQLEAITHLADVEQQIDSARELLKQVTQFAQEFNRHMKQKKKQEQKDRLHNEQTRIRELLQVQELLNLFGKDEVRAAFQSGTDGAIKLSEAELLLLDGLYALVLSTRDRSVAAGVPWPDALDEAAAHGHALLAGSPKSVEVNGAVTTYKELKKLLTTIANCPYFAQQPAEDASRASTPGNQGESSASSTSGVPASGGAAGGDRAAAAAEDAPAGGQTGEREDDCAEHDELGLNNGQVVDLPPPAPVQNGLLEGVTFGNFQQPEPEPPGEVPAAGGFAAAAPDQPPHAQPMPDQTVVYSNLHGEGMHGYDTASSNDHHHESGAENYDSHNPNTMYTNSDMMADNRPHSDYSRQPLAAQQPSHNDGGFGGTFHAGGGEGQPYDDGSFKYRGTGRVFHSGGGRRPRGGPRGGGYRGGGGGGRGGYDGGYQGGQGQGTRGGGGYGRGYGGRGQPRGQAARGVY